MKLINNQLFLYEANYIKFNELLEALKSDKAFVDCYYLDEFQGHTLVSDVLKDKEITSFLEENHNDAYSIYKADIGNLKKDSIPQQPNSKLELINLDKGGIFANDLKELKNLEALLNIKSYGTPIDDVIILEHASKLMDFLNKTLNAHLTDETKKELEIGSLASEEYLKKEV